MKDTENQDSKSRLTAVREKYGELLSLEEVAEVLKYKTVSALRKAHSRGTLPVELKRFPNRRGWFATAQSITDCIDELENQKDQGN